MRRLVFIILMILISASSIAAKDWRGILPLHSTREDVEAVLGPPHRDYTTNKARSVYFLEEGEVYIAYADKHSGSGPNCLVPVPDGTVMVIWIRPTKNLLPLNELRIDQNQFRKFDASEPNGQGYQGLVNEQEGFIIRAFKGNVEEMVYVASASDRPRCPSYYENLEGLVRVSTLVACGLRFDEYGDIRFSDEKARLDNFAIQLMNEQDARGYIIVYAGRKATVAEAQLRANRARDYLINIRKIDPARLKAVDGGHREDLTVFLHIVPSGAEPQPLMPTVDPSQVEIIYEKKRRSRGRPD